MPALPQTAQEFMNWGWPQIEPVYRELEARELTAAGVNGWLADWSRLSELITETAARLYIATTLDTADDDAQQRFHRYLETVIEPVEQAEQNLRQKLLDSGLQPDGFKIPLRNLRAEAELFREENVPLFTQEQKLVNEYDRIVGAQTVRWDGQEVTLEQLRPVYQNPDRTRRESAWRLAMNRWLQDRSALNDLWRQFMDLRRQMAKNAGYDSYRDFRWKQFNRFDYTPQDCETFHAAIEQVVVPAAARLYERRRQRLGLESVRPWDTDVDPLNRPPLRPFSDVAALDAKAEAIFRQVDPQLGDYFGIMRREGLLDLDNRKGKAPGGYQQDLAAVKRPFIFMNAVGIHDDVQTLLHEGGHAFHCFETAALPYIQQRNFGAEIAEVASMSMELLAAPYLTTDYGGYYTPSEAARARVEKLEEMIRFWPYMAVVDAFQHWVYTNHEAASNPDNADAKWDELWGRFMQGVDWSGLDDIRVTGWHRKLHIFQVPFYYVDYGLAQVGAVQVWRNALRDQAQAVRQYRHALSLGGTRTLPELFAAAGATFAFDADTLGDLVNLIETTINDLEAVS
ncbi:MAG: M3 family oligoendopeptidase [Chloroflexi bacterium]|nr:M3 family oligoendopeptidase [Chloroflexota bacterium]MDL1884845.1 M3 family oligoendopeptidase [Anaerolineae bacterium CFX8]